ncbi:alpha/beta hydrolase [Rhodococcus sp. ADH]|uniref:alpha/beta hydrolase n=1 Tax=Rhodococcus sp. ADH TaxID=224843 RepID=UPI0006BA6E2A|nr:alpha/beta hydrolase-fold protein [Rhodococcus sp. ADH]RGP46757.1 hypothetical protein AWH04_07865 [Rhodococcus erythropolis]
MIVLLDISLIDGPVRILILALGWSALVWLLSGRGRRWWLARVPLSLGIGVVAAIALSVGVNKIWKPFPDALPAVALLWVGILVAAGALALLRRTSWAVKGLAMVAVGTIAVCGVAQVNQEFGTYPTMRGVLGVSLADEIDFDHVPGRTENLVTVNAGASLDEVWSPPSDMPENGVVTTVDIAGTVSGFRARDAWIYLPPAYLATPRAQLPVLVLVPGQPGTPRDWFDGGRLNEVADAYAHDHSGLAPVIVVADSLGDQFSQPLCMDSPTANAFTYLSVDVPAWIETNLQVDPDHGHWAVGGFSAGGTCALVLAVNAPTVYPTFVDITGEDEPSLGSRELTVDRVFDGNGEAFSKFNPLDVLNSGDFRRSTGTIVAGEEDPDLPQARHVRDATTAAGMSVRYLELPGGHSWYVWGPGLEQSLPWLATRVNLTA